MIKDWKSPRYICFSVAFLALIVSTPNHQRKGLEFNKEQLGFACELIKEKSHDGVGGPMWDATILLPKQFYSRANLERLFRVYSKRHPNKEERLQVRVYTEVNNVPREGVPAMDRASLPMTNSPSSKPEFRRGLNDAFFVRERDQYFSGGGCNEWYYYSPNLNNPNETITVSLKGGRQFGPKEVLETKEISKAGIKVRITAYNLRHIDPQGTYYMFEYFNEKSREWNGIFTFQQPEQVEIPLEHVRIENSQLAYIFMGGLYSVTTDGGHTWSFWDAEEDLPIGEARIHDLIQEVQIEANGSGLMKLSRTYGQRTGKAELYTIDYGHHWS